jgi:hypothetical protein
MTLIQKLTAIADALTTILSLTSQVQTALADLNTFLDTV